MIGTDGTPDDGEALGGLRIMRTVNPPTCRRVREVFESIFSSPGFRIDFGPLRVVSYSGRSPPVVPPEATRGGGGRGVAGGLDTPLGPGFYALKSENDQTNKKSLKIWSKEIIKTEIIGKKNSRHRHTIGLTDFLIFYNLKVAKLKKNRVSADV